MYFLVFPHYSYSIFLFRICKREASAVFLIEGVLDFLEEQAEPFLTEVLGPLAAPGSLAIINYAIGPQRRLGSSSWKGSTVYKQCPFGTQRLSDQPGGVFLFMHGSKEGCSCSIILARNLMLEHANILVKCKRCPAQG